MKVILLAITAIFISLKSHKIKLFLIGGIAPIYIKGQEEHEKKFEFEYYDYGCTPEMETCSKSYSLQVFEYFDRKYGKSWRNHVRKDVLFLSTQQ